MTIPTTTSDRQTGRTSRQIIEAPECAVFVCAENSVYYAKQLAAALGRPDIRCVITSALTRHGYLNGLDAFIVVDHAAQMPGVLQVDIRRHNERVQLRRVAKGGT